GGHMSRKIPDEPRIHPAIRDAIARNHSDIVREVDAAVTANDFVAVGMKQNPIVKQAKNTLAAKSNTYTYLEYGSYFSDWHRLNALKMCTGWPTFPMIFVRGVFIGGASNVGALIANGELARLLAAPRQV